MKTTDIFYVERWGIVLAFRDIINFFKFKKEIREEIKNPHSKFNAFGLNRNKLGNVLYIQCDFVDSDFMGADYNNERMVMNYLKPIIMYLNDDIRWGEYLDIQISQFYDEDELPTYSYAVEFLYIFQKFSFKWLFKWISIILGVGVSFFVLLKIISIFLTFLV